MAELNQYVLVRTENAGVHFGILKSKQAFSGGYAVTIDNCRRIWAWDGANCCNDIALHGIANHDQTKISAPCKDKDVFAVEILPIEPEALENLNSHKHWNYSTKK